MPSMRAAESLSRPVSRSVRRIARHSNSSRGNISSFSGALSVVGYCRLDGGSLRTQRNRPLDGLFQHPHELGLDRRGERALDVPEQLGFDQRGHQRRTVYRRERTLPAADCASPYGLAFFAGAGADVFFLAVSPPPRLSNVKASLALKGKRRTDCSPVVLRVTSTRRLLARRTVRRFFRIFCFSAGVMSGSASISFFTSSDVMFFSKPNARVSRWSAGTPFSMR